MPMDASQDGRTRRRWRTAELAMEPAGKMDCWVAGLLDKSAILALNRREVEDGNWAWRRQSVP